MAIATRSKLAALPLVLALFAAGCGTGFDPPSEVNTLRVLGVQKSQPYPAPDEEVELTMLWHDPFMQPDDSARVEPDSTPVERVWIGRECNNPAGDLYYSCFSDEKWLNPQPDEMKNGMMEPERQLLAHGDRFTFKVRNDIVTGREAHPGQPQYGIIFVFFAVCKGKIAFEPSAQQGALPITCRNGDVVVGPDKFIAGYTSLYVFPRDSERAEVFRNANPVITGFEINGKKVAACVGAAPGEDGSEPCRPGPLPDSEGAPAASYLAPANCDDDPDRCFDACGADGDSKCPNISLRPILSPDIAEPDEISATYYNRAVGEQMWINYYVDRGSTKSPVRLLNDAVSGWNADYGTQFWAPSSSGVVTLWAVVHDNRGGVNWTSTQVRIR